LEGTLFQKGSFQIKMGNIWSISFIIDNYLFIYMAYFYEEYGITQAFAFDQHFMIAGFTLIP